TVTSSSLSNPAASFGIHRSASSHPAAFITTLHLTRPSSPSSHQSSSSSIRCLELAVATTVAFLELAVTIIFVEQWLSSSMLL
ncbi:hypothetical protein HN873_043997, partial [Arachis hypogaea]